VVNYAHPEDTRKAIAALDRSTHPCSVIVVDNGPPIGKTERLGDLDTEVLVVEAGDNLGFAGGSNLGIALGLARGVDFVWLINPDVVVAEGALALLLEASTANPRAGFLSPRIYHGGSDPKKIWFDGGKINWKRGGATRHLGSGMTDDQRPVLEPFRVDYVTGAAVLVRAEVFNEVGLMREDYFMYYEETDLCVRAARANWHSYVVPQARADHFRRSTEGDLPQPYFIYYTVRNRIIFGTRFSDWSAGAIVADLAPFIAGWRDRVGVSTPEWMGVFDWLVGVAIEDGEAGVVGRRDDIAGVTVPSP
jgi:hypothetical protein